MLHRAHAGAGGAQHVGHGLVALEVDEVVVPVRRRRRSGPATSHSWRVGAGRLRPGEPRGVGGCDGGRGGEAGGDGRRRTGGDAFGHAVVEFVAAAAGADDLLVPDHACAGTKPPAHRPSAACPGAGCAGAPPGSSRRRRPADRRRSRSTPGGEFAVVVDAADGDAVEPAVCRRAGGVGDGAADQHPDAGLGGGCRPASVSCGRASTTAATSTPAAQQVRGQGVGASRWWC